MYMNAETKASLERILGKSLEEISAMDFDEEVRFVEEKTKKKQDFSKLVDPRINGRGNPLLVRRRVMTMQDVDKKMSELK